MSMFYVDMQDRLIISSFEEHVTSLRVTSLRLISSVNLRSLNLVGITMISELHLTCVLTTVIPSLAKISIPILLVVRAFNRNIN
jgi:hypothetical protein